MRVVECLRKDNKCELNYFKFFRFKKFLKHAHKVRRFCKNEKVKAYYYVIKRNQLVEILNITDKGKWYTM